MDIHYDKDICNYLPRVDQDDTGQIICSVLLQSTDYWEISRSRWHLFLVYHKYTSHYPRLLLIAYKYLVYQALYKLVYESCMRIHMYSVREGRGEERRVTVSTKQVMDRSSI